MHNNKLKLISTPIDFPKIEPDNWDNWWSYWNNYSSLVSKISKNHNQNSNSWRGVDLYIKKGYEDLANNLYKFPYIDGTHLVQNFFSMIDKFPMDVNVIRAISSLNNVKPHKDFDYPNYSLRSIIYDDNPKQTWWYYYDRKIKFLNMPNFTNTWVYADHETTHGSMYYKNHKKIILMFFGDWKEGSLEKIYKDAKNKFSEFVLYKN